MSKQNSRRAIPSLLLLIALLLLLTALPLYAGSQARGHEFVKRAGPALRLHGKEFRFAGTNNYYLMYKSQFMVDDLLETAAANDFNVVRTWGFFDIGTLDGSPPTSTHGPQEGVYFHYWDTTAGAPAYNDGPDGLERLDYVVYKAGQEGVRLVIPLTNNWSDFGGMDQYVRWREASLKRENASSTTRFCTDMAIRLVQGLDRTLLNRTNIYYGRKYKDDPTIMTWELGNEPRCVGSGNYPSHRNHFNRRLSPPGLTKCRAL